MEPVLKRLSSDEDTAHKKVGEEEMRITESDWIVVVLERGEIDGEEILVFAVTVVVMDEGGPGTVRLVL